MAGVKGRSGTNKGQDKPFRDALRLAINEVQGDVKKLRAIANKLVDKAIEGDVKAIVEVADRIDGKADIRIQASHEHNHQFEPVSETARWLAEIAGVGAAGEAKKPLPH